MTRARRRKNVVVKEVSLVDHPAIQRKFIFFKNDSTKEVNGMDKELEFLEKDDDREKEIALEMSAQKVNLVKQSINSINKILSDMSKSAGYRYQPKFKELGSDEVLESEVDPGGPNVDEVVGAFDQVFGEKAGVVKGVFQGLSTVVTSMAESVGFKTNLTFSKIEAEPDKEPDKPPEQEPPSEETQGDKEKDKKKDDDEELTEKEQELCDELEKLNEELSDQNITPERYATILQRIGAIELELKGGDK